MNCIFCEKRIPDGSVWCDHCGACQSRSTEKAQRTGTPLTLSLNKTEAIKVPMRKRTVIVITAFCVILVAVVSAIVLNLIYGFVK